MIWDWIVGSIPPWVWLVLAGAVVLVIVSVLKGDGWKWALGAAVAGVVAYLQAKSYHRGADAQKAKQDAADDKARDIIADKKEDVRTIPPDEREERFKRWEKPS